MAVESARRKVALVALCLLLAACTLILFPSLFPMLDVYDVATRGHELHVGVSVGQVRSGECKFTGRYSLSRKPFHLPDDYSKPVKVIMREKWVCDLRKFLGRMESNTSRRMVSIIASDSNFTDPLLNWLIKALVRTDKPIRDLLVISMDAPLHSLLISRGIASLYVPPDSVMYTSNFPPQYHRHNSFYQTRLIVMRIINHWGFDVANYDTDALILRNPRSLYSRYPTVDIFGGFAISYPLHLHQIWGVTLCCGSWLVRSSAATELFWETVSSTSNKGGEKGMDQYKVNAAFERMKLKWSSTSHSQTTFDLSTEWRGSGEVQVLILPLRVICRQRFCEEKKIKSYYIWHKGSNDKTAEAKRESVQYGGLWFLKDNWRTLTVQSHLSGIKWLKYIQI